GRARGRRLPLRLSHTAPALHRPGHGERGHRSLHAGDGAAGAGSGKRDSGAGGQRLHRGEVIMFRPFLVAVILLLLGGSAFAQQVDVAASVPVRSPTGSGVRNLTFGEVTPLAGTTQTIDVPAAAAPQSATIQSGEFRYDLTATRGISFNVTMPTQLTAPGADPLVMTANGSQYGAYCVSNTAACSLTSFNPSAGQTITVCRTMIF